MKTIQFIFCSCFALLIFTSCNSSTSASGNQENQLKIAEEVSTAIHSNTYKVEVNYMTPSGRPSQTLITPYSVEVRNDSVYSYLPYVGRAYSATYGGAQSPLIFGEPIEEYKVAFGKKGKADITFKTRTREDHYTYRLTIFSNTSASLNITSNNRQAISFQGKLVLP